MTSAAGDHDQTGRPSVEVRHVGLERSPVVTIDNFLPGCERLVDYAASQARLRPPEKGFYPGLRDRVPQEYLRHVVGSLSRLIAEVFGFPHGQVTMADSYLSMVTLPPAQTRPDQRLPHVDTVEPNRIAVLHYLCGPEQGGTSLYRHRGTGFETLSPARFPLFQRALNAEVQRPGALQQGYMNGDTPLFERIHQFEAAFNRLVIYRSCNLHSGDIPPDFKFDANPRTGRLTANTFLELR